MTRLRIEVAVPPCSSPVPMSSCPCQSVLSHCVGQEWLDGSYRAVLTTTPTTGPSMGGGYPLHGGIPQKRFWHLPLYKNCWQEACAYQWQIRSGTFTWPGFISHATDNRAEASPHSNIYCWNILAQRWNRALFLVSLLVKLSLYDKNNGIQKDINGIK